MFNITNLFTIIILNIFALYCNAASLPEYSYTEIYTYDNQELNNIDSPSDAKAEISDPFYVINRHIFNINYLLDKAFFAPIAETYLAVIPKRGRVHIANFMSNISEPLNFINLVFQGNFKQARITIGRFLANTVLGFFGILDVAAQAKLTYSGEDFGKTLARYGAPSGPYIVAPILGPTSFRDVSGKVADFFMDPFKYTLHREYRDIINITWLVHKRAEVNEVVKTVNRSLDPYETAKLLYIQNRNSQILK
jgi:phospholipid-binding lipoprotein MlaA